MAQIDIRLDDDLDIAVPTRLVTGIDLVKQRIHVRLATHRGDVLRDAKLGLPWVDWFGLKPFPFATVAARIRREIEGIPGVVTVLEVTVTPDGAGSVAVAAEVTAAEGRLSIRQVVADGGTKNLSFAAIVLG